MHTQQIPHMGHTLRITAAAVAAAVLGSMATALPAFAADNGAWAAFPSRPASATSLSTPSQYVVLDVAGGATVRSRITITNAARVARPLLVYPADAFNVAAGGDFGVKAPEDQQSDVGAWIRPDRRSVVVPAARYDRRTGRYVPGSTDVGFTTSVPVGAQPGDHAGALVTLEPSPSSSLPGANGVRVGVQRSLGVRVYVRVAGPLRPQLVVSDIHYRRLSADLLPFVGPRGSADVSYTYTNIGNQRVVPTITLAYAGALGNTVHVTRRTARPEVLPGQSVTLTDHVSGVSFVGPFTAKVTVNGAQGTSIEPAVGDTRAWRISWIVLLVALVALIALAVRPLLARRRRRTAPIDQLTNDAAPRTEDVTS